MASHGDEDRRYWVALLERIARPVLSAAAEGRLGASLPPSRPERGRAATSEAICRTLVGIAPWLELDAAPEAERPLQAELRDLARRSIGRLTDPASPDFCSFDEIHQNLVEAAFLSHALLRAPMQLWQELDDAAKPQVIVGLRRSRRLKPAFNNWLLFAAMVEAWLKRAGEWWDPMRVDYAVRQHEQWYLGDGVYGDGPPFHWDYYNSFVIQPMLLDVAETVADEGLVREEQLATFIRRSQRYAVVQERLISPEGALPPIGRSLAYRFGCLQLLGQMALRRQLPEELQPAQVRGAMTAAIRRLAEAPGTFREDGWLSIGFAGDQPSLGEPYISAGSVYLCTAGLLPLGLPADDPFWADPPADWTARRVYGGADVPRDHAIRE